MRDRATPDAVLGFISRRTRRIFAADDMPRQHARRQAACATVDFAFWSPCRAHTTFDASFEGISHYIGLFDYIARFSRWPRMGPHACR